MSEQEQFEQWFENDTKGLDKASARAGWVERMAQESAELEHLRAKLAAYESQEPYAVIEHGPFDDVGMPKFVRVTTPKSAPFDIENLPHGLKLYASPATARIVMPEWISVKDEMPESGRHVLACYVNSLGKSRRIRAEYVAAKSREVDFDFADPETQCVEYDETADLYHLSAGWYELIDNWEEYSSVAVTEGDVTHWQPLPEAPAEQQEGGAS